MFEKFNGSNTEALLQRHYRILNTYNNLFDLQPKQMTDLFEVLFYYLYGFRCDIYSEEGKYVICIVNANGQRRVDVFQYSDKPLNMRAVDFYKTNPIIQYNYRSKDQYTWFTNVGWLENAETKAENQHITTIAPGLMGLIFNHSFAQYEAVVKDWNAKHQQRPTKKQIKEDLRDVARWKAQKEADEDDDDMPWELKLDILDDLMGDW